jgi:hypothetical protein
MADILSQGEVNALLSATEEIDSIDPLAEEMYRLMEGEEPRPAHRPLRLANSPRRIPRGTTVAIGQHYYVKVNAVRWEPVTETAT